MVDDGLLSGVPDGRSGAHALSAAATVGFEVFDALGSVVPVAPLDAEAASLAGSATP